MNISLRIERPMLAVGAAHFLAPGDLVMVSGVLRKKIAKGGVVIGAHGGKIDIAMGKGLIKTWDEVVGSNLGRVIWIYYIDRARQLIKTAIDLDSIPTHRPAVDIIKSMWLRLGIDLPASCKTLDDVVNSGQVMPTIFRVEKKTPKERPVNPSATMPGIHI